MSALSAAMGSMIPGVGSLASSALQYSNAEQNRSFQRSMDSTRYRRAVTDMKAAGLNPILAAGGPQTGSGGQGSPMGAIENPVNSALMAKKINAEVDNIKAQTRLVNNKGSVTDPMASIGKLIESWIGSPTDDAASAGPDAWEAAKQAIRKAKKQHDNGWLKKQIKSRFNSAKSFLNRGGKYDIEAKGYKE